ncbi:MAG: SDR family NAD(P)-dependent oxidoreductase [Crocinitomicaceae bacterium]|nr:SDR family NAD(P)-dependent oxidoreductase [Crocinitomicaceae bacterium]
MIIVTGASRGIGHYLFNHFLENTNEKVVGIYNNTKPDKNLELYYQLDITKHEDVQKFIDMIDNDLTDLTLINCAGITYNSFTHKSDQEKWKDVIDVNLIGSYNMIRSILPKMREERFGRIINFSSVVAIKPTAGVSAYSASKSALWGLTKSVAIENAALNVTINNINLGYSELGMIEMVPEEFIKSIIDQIPAGILCEPKDILNTVNYLRQTRYITGNSIDVSGGLI